MAFKDHYSIAAILVRFRYLCVGGLCAMANWILMLAIDREHYFLSTAICFPVVGTFAYCLHARWTFRHRASVSAWFRYLCCMLPSYPISLGLLWLLHDAIGLSLTYSVPAATVALTILNFSLARWTIAHRRAAAAQAPIGPQNEISVAEPVYP